MLQPVSFIRYTFGEEKEKHVKMLKNLKIENKKIISI